MKKGELKIHCRAVMMTHLESVGYPDMSRRQILNELKAMWRKFEDEGLMDSIKSMGCTFQQFNDLAERIAQETAIMEKFERVGNILKRKKV